MSRKRGFDPLDKSGYKSRFGSIVYLRRSYLYEGEDVRLSLYLDRVSGIYLGDISKKHRQWVFGDTNYRALWQAERALLIAQFRELHARASTAEAIAHDLAEVVLEKRKRNQLCWLCEQRRACTRMPEGWECDKCCSA